MCFSDFSSCNLIGLSSSIAISISNNLSADEISILSIFLNSLADNLGIVATKKSIEESNKNYSL